MDNKSQVNNSILVIGGHGMLGRPVVRRFVQDGFPVTVLARNPGKASALFSQGPSFVAGDLQNVGSIDAALQGCQAVYVSVETPPNAKFRPESDGVANVIQALNNHPKTRLMILSAFGVSDPRAKDHPWWHVREKHRAQTIVKNSHAPWTIFEPTWFMESLPLFVKGKSFSAFSGVRLAPYWVAGDDYGRMISKALKDKSGMGEIIPVQGSEKFSLDEAAAFFINAYDPSIQLKHIPFFILRAVGLFSARARDFATLLKLESGREEPAPDPNVWLKFGRPEMSIAGYAAYVRRTADFPQK